MVRNVAFLLVAALLCACGSKKTGVIAELTKAEGPVERQQGVGAWGGAAVGTKFYLGDASRTADGAAQITLATTQVIEMSPHTVLRFGPGMNNATNIKVELGAIDIVNSSSTGFDIGNVKVDPGGKVRITANDVELLIGKAELSGTTLEIGKPIGLDIGPAVVVDAGVDAAPIPVDAAVVAGDVTFDITGTGVVEMRGPNDKTWGPVTGKGTIPLGASLRVKKGAAKATLVSGTTTLELSGASSQITIKDNLLMGLELGTGLATVPAASEGKVGVPGGEVDLTGTKDNAAEARIDVNQRGEAKIAMLHGGAKLVGANGSSNLEMAGGESATLLKAGTINPGVVIPRFFDFQVKVGEDKSFTVHDPKGSTALQFDFNGKCAGGGTIELDHSSAFHTPRVSEGKETANMLVPAGSWAWRLRCGGNVPGSGQIAVVADAGRRPLPPKANKNAIDADGLTYTIFYQSLIPNVAIRFKGTGAAFKLHIATGGAEEVYDGAASPIIEVPGKKLKEATYTYWFEKDGVKQDKISTLKIEFDQKAAQVYIESPIDGQPFGADVNIAGAALPGWTAKIGPTEIPVTDPATRRFHATVQPPSGGAQALAIRLSHPQRGIHFYLRRGAPASK